MIYQKGIGVHNARAAYCVFFNQRDQVFAGESFIKVPTDIHLAIKALNKLTNELHELLIQGKRLVEVKVKPKILQITFGDVFLGIGADMEIDVLYIFV